MSDQSLMGASPFQDPEVGGHRALGGFGELLQLGKLPGESGDIGPNEGHQAPEVSLCHAVVEGVHPNEVEERLGVGVEGTLLLFRLGALEDGDVLLVRDLTVRHPLLTLPDAA